MSTVVLYQAILVACLTCYINSFCPIESLCKLRTSYSIQGEFLTTIIPKNPHCIPLANSIFIEGINKIVCSNNYEEGFSFRSINEIIGKSISVSTICSKTYEANTLKYHVVVSKSPNFKNGLIEIISPPYGSIVHNVLNITVGVSAKHSNFVDFTVIGIINNTIPSSALSNFPLSGQNIEPASWFYTLTPVRDASFSFDAGETSGVTFFAMSDSDSLNDRRKTSSNLQMGYPTYGYIEFVLSDEEIAQHRRHNNHNKLSQPELGGQKTAKQFSVNQAEPINICIWSSVKMDGQKSIWLQQTRYMDRSRFRFVWILSLPEGGRLDVQQHPHLLGNDSVYKYLLQIQQEQRSDSGSKAVLEVVDSPYNGFAIDRDDLHTEPGDGSASAEHFWEGDVTRLYKYAHDRLVAAHFKIDDVTPIWCREFYLTMRTTLLAQQCDVVVFGNSRGFSSDVFITDTARLLVIPSASELLNLYLDVDVLPDALVGPSEYAVNHDSITSMKGVVEALRSEYKDRYDHLKVPFSTVISPAVDCQKQFNPALYSMTSGLARGGCEDVSSLRGEASPCFSVGFVARLSPEKSPGLFLLAAHELLQLYPFARFVIVGDGPLRQSLEDLAARLEISWAVSFLGWVGNDQNQLSEVLRGLDAVVNPSLRAWSETFCIANIEAMAMAVPLVTFAVGGVGEYVQDPSLTPGNTSQSTLYTVGPNAVVVNTATPQAIARAVHYLVKNPEMRLQIGQAGRRTIQQHFSVERQMRQYEQFYKELAVRK